MENKIINNFLRYLTEKGVSPTSLKYYKSDISNFLSWKGSREISNNLVKEYLNSIRLFTPNSTINRRLSTLRSYSQFINKNFMHDIENVSANKVQNQVSESKANGYKAFQERIIGFFAKSQRVQNILFKVFFNRPNWYKRYHSYPLATYIHIAILILFSSISGYAVYDQVFYSTDRSLAFPTNLERPNRFLSFQGRLTDDLGNPETVATNMVFNLYSVSSGGSSLWNSGTCSITPDQDGVFSTLLGSSCGAEIASSVFSENADIWLGVTVAGDAEATPRIQIATVAYALNSETLQGFPAGTGTSTIPYINSSGTMVLANASPKIQSTSGTFAVEGQALTITTPNTSNGIITINPDGTGTLDLTFEGAAPGGGANGFVNATNANITSGSLYSGTVASNASGYNFINFLSGSSPASVFSVQNDGDIITAGDITVGGGNINTGNIALTIGDGTTDSVTVSTDGTGNGEVVLPNDSIGPNELLSTGQTDEYCLTYETTGTTMEWQVCGAGGSSQWNDLTAPDGNLSINHSTYTTAFNWATGTGANNLFSLTTDASANGTGSLLNLQTGASSTVSPLRVRAGAIEGMFISSAGNVGIGLTNPIAKLQVKTDSSNTTGKSALIIDQYENQDIFTASASGTTKMTLENDGTLRLVNASSTISNDSGDINITSAANLVVTTDGTGNGEVVLPNDSIGPNELLSTGQTDEYCLTYETTGTTMEWQVCNSSLFTDGGDVTYLASTTDDFAIGGTTLAASMFGIDESAGNFYFGYDNSANPTFNFEATDADAGEFGFNTNDSFYFANANLGIGTTAPDARIDSLATSGEQLRLTYTDGSVYSGFTLDSNGYLLIDPTGARVAIDGSLQVGSTSPLAYSRFGTGTTTHSGNINASNDLLLSSDLEIDGNLYLDSGTIANSAGTASVILTSDPINTSNTLSASNWTIENTANVGQAALIVNNTKSGDLITASASGVTKFTVQGDGDVVLTNQIQLGNLASNPTALGAGAMYFNTTTNTNQCYNGIAWFNCGGTLYSNTNASVADGSYITVTHNLATNDLLSSAWINAQGLWKELDTAYKPAIAWEGKDTQKGIYHNNINVYSSGNESSLTSSSLNEGILYDTFEDQIKTDSANTTVSVDTQTGDDGSSNYITLDQRIQAGRIGLIGSQTYSTSTTDNDGQTYLGSNTVNDIYYYDRSKDSTPEVLVELGIDPNWYNGVTLSVATGSAHYSQNGTLAEKNPNLTTSYNGSLIKATGTDTTPRTIFITIKSPTTFDWTNYQGDAATGVTITPGVAQTLGSTGVSATFTAANYNTGDVFKIASWYIEPESATRGARQQFPERSNIIATASSVDIIDADTQKLWMRFAEGVSSDNTMYGTSATDAYSVTQLNGNLYISISNGGVRKINFTTDNATGITTLGIYDSNAPITIRNTGVTWSLVNPVSVVSAVGNDVSAAVIPNQPTQEVTVGGWGYINTNGSPSTYASETVNLPYKFNQIPNITVSYAGYKLTAGNPSNLSDCQYSQYSSTYVETIAARAQRNDSFGVEMHYSAVEDRTTYAACYTWTATGVVSPKQFVAVATGATGADGGTTVINETDGTKVDLLVGSQYANNQWQSKIAITSNNRLYSIDNESPANLTAIIAYKNVHALTSETAWVGNYSHFYGFGYGLVSPIGGGLSQATSFSVTEGTSTVNNKGNTLYVGGVSGTTVIQENIVDGSVTNQSASSADGLEESIGSVKYYTKDYISEEMVGDIRGMWPLNNANTASDFEDVSIKANTLTGTNITANGDSVSGVRGTATDFNGTDEYMSCSDASCGGTSKLDSTGTAWSFGTWINSSNITKNYGMIITKSAGAGGANDAYELRMNGTTGKLEMVMYTGSISSALGNQVLENNKWYHVVGTYDGAYMRVYVNGQLDVATAKTGSMVDSTAEFRIGSRSDGNTFNFQGYIDEPFATAITLTPAQIKNMYQIGYRALQSHGTGLGGGSADTNQQLGYISTGTSSVGAVATDYNNQYMYVGTNSTTLGALSKIQLNSDTNIKTYTSSANVPTGGTTLIDEDINSLAVGYNLEAVGSAAGGVKSIGVDNNATATSGNYVSKTYVLPKNIGSAVLWVSPIIDANDGSNTLTVKASNNGGSSYATCTLVNTNSNPTVPEKEYACTFSAADNDLKVKFEFVRGSTKTNTYITQYGITWLGETGFRVEQNDSNNVRLYNFSGETQNLKLNVTGATTTQLANPWTDGGSYLYPTGYESLRVYDGTGTNYLGLAHDGTLANLNYNGTTVLSINSAGDLLPNTNDTQSLGSDTKRWKDLFLGGETLHVGSSTTDEATLSYNSSTNVFNIGTDSTTNGDIALFTDDLYLDKSTGNVGIGDTTPLSLLSVGNGDLFQVNSSGAIAAVVGITSSGGTINLNNNSNFATNINTGTSNAALTLGGGSGTVAINSSDWGISTTGVMTGIGAITSDGQLTLSGSSANIALGSNYLSGDGGDEGININSTGQVGIGAAASGSYPLHVGGQINTTSQYSFNNWYNLINGSGTNLDLQTYSGYNINFNGHNGGSATTYMMIEGGGNVGIGTTIPDSKLSVGGPGLSVVTATIQGSTNTISTYSINTVDSGGTSTFWINDSGAGYLKAAAWAYGSDRRMKKNINYDYVTDGLNKINNLKPVSFEYLDSDISQLGFIAQEIKEVIPEAVVTNDLTGMLGLKTDFIIPYLVKAIQEQQLQIEEIKLNQDGDAILEGSSLADYKVTTDQGPVTKVGNFAKATIARLNVGFGKFNEIETQTISPVANTDLIIDLDPNNSTDSAKLAIKGVDDQEVASIDAMGNAEFDGTVTSNDLNIVNDATVSGTLYADDIQSAKLTEIEELLREVEGNQELLASARDWDSQTATDSGMVLAESVETSNLFVTGIAAIDSVSVTQSISFGNDFVFQSLDNSINTLVSPLQLQSLAMAPLEIMAGKIKIDTDGNTVFLGNVEIAGNLNVNGDTTIKNAIFENLVVASTINEATESAEIVEGEINTNSVAGKAMLLANTDLIRINNPKVKEGSLIYVTPISSTQNRVLFVKSKGEGYFEIGFSEALDSDVEFNWWIIELQDSGMEVISE